MIGQEEAASSCGREGLDLILGKNTRQNGCQVLEEAAQGTQGRVTMPGEI